MTLHLVLVEPAGARNLGSVARLCANFGVAELRLVAPRCDPLGAEARQMAVHAQAVLEAAPQFVDLAAALADCGRVVAATGRLEGAPLPLHGPAAALDWLGAGGDPAASATGAPATGAAGGGEVAPGPLPVALVFGREDRGLSNDELLMAGRLLRLEAGSAYDSLNLSHAVAVVLHEWHQRRGQRAAPLGSAPMGSAAGGSAAGTFEPLGAGELVGRAFPEPAARAALEAALGDAEALLLEVGFLLPHTARARMAKLRALLQRAQPDSGEVALLRGMVAQLRWAARRPCPPGAPH
jgi:tRNA/rRNA methyltransferase